MKDPFYSFDAFEHRSEVFESVNRKTWSNWIWQQQNALRNMRQFQKVFKNFSDEQLSSLMAWQQRGFRLLITPYVLALIQKDEKGNPLHDDPIWSQVFPVFNQFLYNNNRSKADVYLKTSRDEYAPNLENWEIAEEMISPIAQHKYDNRAIIYTADVCLGYCLYCFRSLQSDDIGEKHGGRPYWRETMEALYKRPQIEEVILSGGDPLIYDNTNIDLMLKDLRSIPSIKAIRIHTRAWTHNPYRIDRDFCELLKKYKVTEMGVHIVHPGELTRDLDQALERIRVSGARTLLLTDTPLIKGINDNVQILHELFMGLYIGGIKPYYLSHNMPNIPAAAIQRTSVRRGLEIYNRLKRHISNTAMPEYIICHRSGKKTVPESIEGAADFIYEHDKDGYPIIRFKNWKGEWEIYLDGVD